MQIDPAVHERFVNDFGLNMLNTLTSKEHRETAHKRRIFVFDERGGVFGGPGDFIQSYQNLTTGVFHSKRRQIVGVRYRCKPNDLAEPELGGFHTHPALFSKNTRQVRRRIDRLLWLSEMDRLAFLKQHELYGFEWHFVGTIDIGCFHIEDVLAGESGPREVLRHPDLPGVIERLAPHIEFFDRVLQSQAHISRTIDRSILEQIFQRSAGVEASIEEILNAPVDLPEIAERVAHECQLVGYSSKQVNLVIKRTRRVEPEIVQGFSDRIDEAYQRLSALNQPLQCTLS
ncbi:MAG: hypothetical protein ACM3YO_02000 [Bacteroidota bacterium]